jgi:hypothetical protein
MKKEPSARSLRAEGEAIHPLKLAAFASDCSTTMQTYGSRGERRDLIGVGWGWIASSLRSSQ